MILKNGTVITMNDEELVQKCDILVKGNKITAIGINIGGVKDSEVIDCTGKIILPGLINSHTHTALCLVRGVAEEKGLAPAYTKSIPLSTNMSKEEMYYLSMLGAIEALRFGSTMIVENYIESNTAVEAYAALGMRAIVSERVHDVQFDLLPEGRREYKESIGKKTLEDNLRLYEKWHNKENGRITCSLGPHATDTCSDKLLKQIKRFSEELNLGVTIHLAQSKGEVEYIKETTGLSPVEYLESVGLLNKNLLAAHCIYVNDSDISLMGKDLIHVAHIPEGNAKGGMMAPVEKMRKENINITIGTDNMQGDLIESMRFGLCVGRIMNSSFRDPDSMSILKTTTRNAARALNVEHELGSIEIGKKADFVIIDKNKPHLTPCVDPVGNVLHTASGSDVDKVIIDGKLIVDNGNVLTVDTEFIMKEVNKIAKKRWKEVGKEIV